MSNDNDEIRRLPCPFCGVQPYKERVRDGWEIRCQCGAAMTCYDGSYEPVEHKWNLRQPEK